MSVPTARLDYGKPLPTTTGHLSLNVPPNMDPRIAGFRVGACAKEPWTVQFIESMPSGSVFYDLGANVGSYSLLAAALGYTTVAVEPSFANYEALCRNAALNNLLDKLIILPIALGTEPSFDWFQYRDLRPGTAMHQMGQPPGQRPVFFHRQKVMVFSLDWLVEVGHLPAPSHVKLDVDGGESAVLAGMERSLKAPGFVALLVEMPLKQEEAISKRLTEWGLTRTARFNERGGKELPDICYAIFQRSL